MEDDQPDSLEGWVPVREDLFAEPERHQLRFLVAWNDAEGKFAVTCHDRTAQRQQRRREGSRPGSPPPSWAGLLSAAGLRGAHRQLAALWPPLECCFPPLPPELEAGGGAWGLWTLVWPARPGPGDAALQELCARLERYLGLAAEGCGGAAVRDALLPADGGAPDCESPRAFRERALRARLAEAGARLQQVTPGHPLPVSVPGPSVGDNGGGWGVSSKGPGLRRSRFTVRCGERGARGHRCRSPAGSSHGSAGRAGGPERGRVQLNGSAVLFSSPGSGGALCRA